MQVSAPDGTTAFVVSTIGGSGGSPSGSASSFPGRFGPKGDDGDFMINGRHFP